MTLALLCVWTAACAPASSSTGARSSEWQAERPPYVVSAAPATINVELDDQTRQDLARHLGRGSLPVARLIVRDVRPQAAQALKGVRVFIEKPTANAGTPVDDPSYAGSFVLGLGESESVLLNVAPTLTRLWTAGGLTAASLEERKALRLTLVPEPWDFAAALPADFTLAIQAIALEVPRQP